MRDLDVARARLAKGDVTLVLCCADNVYTTAKRGVAPLLELLDSKADYSGFSAADKVVGKGAAFLYVLLAVRCVYAAVISESAREVLERAGIPVEYERCVPYIQNRAGDGRCPIEQAVLDESDAAAALARIRARLAALRQ